MRGDSDTACCPAAFLLVYIQRSSGVLQRVRISDTGNIFEVSCHFRLGGVLWQRRPHFIIFYNGTEEQTDKRELHLSDTLQVKEEDPRLELRATMRNINKGHKKRSAQDSLSLTQFHKKVIICVSKNAT